MNISRESGNGELENACQGHIYSPDLLETHLRHTITSIPLDKMAPSRSHSRPAWLLSLLAVASMLCPTSALYFYLDGTTPKCFYEELPKDTMVVGMYCLREVLCIKAAF
jgi:hypothetical protein